MAIKDKNKKPFINDRDDNVFIGIDLPFRKSDGREGWFASTETTIESVKNNIRNLVQTQQGERYFQPFLGINLRKYMFEQITQDVILKIQNDILDTFKIWLPFVEVQDIKVDFEETVLNKNNISLNIIFNIKQDPNTLESVQVDIGE